MDSKHKGHEGLLKETTAVSPVIGTILMVAVAVMLAAGVYVWAGAFDNNQDTPEQVRVRTTTLDTDDNGQSDWIRITMTSAEGAPYGPAVIGIETLDPSGTLHTDICQTPALSSGACADGFDTGDTWDVGQSLYVQCHADGEHFVTLTVSGTTVSDGGVNCDESA